MYDSRRGCIPWNKGKKGVQIAWNKGLKNYLKGKELSEETKKKMSLAQKGRIHTEQAKEKNRIAHLGLNAGEKNWHWITDRTQLKQRSPRGWDGKLSYEYLAWMKGVKNRDGWKCQIANSDCSGRLEAHHILSWRDYPELRYQINNGITLCQSHHPRKKVDEERYVKAFQELVTAKAQ